MQGGSGIEVSVVRCGPVQGGNGWFGLRELVQSCTSGCSQFLALSGVKGTSPAQVRRAQGRERVWKRGARWDVDSDVRREVELGGNTSVLSQDTDSILYAKVWCVSSVKVKKSMWRLDKGDKGDEMRMCTM
jgi:hypothetical protein